MGIRILVIEDEAEIADFITRGLREEGYIVEHAADGLEAFGGRLITTLRGRGYVLGEPPEQRQAYRK